MRKSTTFLGAVLLVGVLVSGCAGPEKKLGRGFTNLFAIGKLSEVTRSVEQTAVFGSPNYSYATGLVRGLNQSLARSALGVYEIVTFPIPSYDPVLTKYIPAVPGHADSFTPGLIESSTFSTDQYVGFSGGELAPFIPGSRFSIYPN